MRWLAGTCDVFFVFSLLQVFLFAGAVGSLGALGCMCSLLLQQRSILCCGCCFCRFVSELLPTTELAGVACAAAWEAKAVYAVCTLIDEGVFLAAAAAPEEAPLALSAQHAGSTLQCPFWLEGVAEVD